MVALHPVWQGIKGEGAVESASVISALNSSMEPFPQALHFLISLVGSSAIFDKAVFIPSAHAGEQATTGINAIPAIIKLSDSAETTAPGGRVLSRSFGWHAVQTEFSPQ
jgi:hypothetical protein